MKSCIRYFHGTATEFHNDSLPTEAASKYHEEDPIVPDSLEDVQLVMNLSSIDKIEDLHHSENVEYVGHVSADTKFLLILAVERRTIPILDSARENVRLITTEAILYLWLGIEMLTGENDGVDNDDLVNSHTQQVLYHFS